MNHGLRTAMLFGMLSAWLTILTITSCEEADVAHTRTVFREPVANVRIEPGIDTLLFSSADSASTALIVRVSDAAGLSIVGAPVEVTIGDPALGWVRYHDAILRNTSDAHGHVRLRYEASGLAGDQTIWACAGGLCDSAVVVIREHAVAPFLGLDLLPDYQEARTGERVSVNVVALYTRQNGDPIEGAGLWATGLGGTLDPLLLMVTNDSGIARTTWKLDASNGQHCLTVSDGTIQDVGCTTVAMEKK